MGDGGLALGAAVLGSTNSSDVVRLRLDRLDLGPSYGTNEIEASLRAAGLRVDGVPGIPSRVADLLAEGRIVMWFQGAMEYGPRALGQRSVLARPDRLDIRDRLNLALKRRVWYQPFCPSLLENDARRMLADWDGGINRSMTMAYEVAREYRCHMAGVMSVDGTCRPQIVDEDDAGDFAELLREARRRWGAGVVLNTSFNIHGEPLVCAPAEAVDVFLRSGADALAIGPYLVTRPE
jgi:carbamoyltransferase